MAKLAINCAASNAQTNKEILKNLQSNKEQIYTWINLSCVALKVPVPAIDVLESFAGECVNALKSGISAKRVKEDIKSFVVTHRDNVVRHKHHEAQNRLASELYLDRAWFESTQTNTVKYTDEERELMIKNGLIGEDSAEKKSYPIKQAVRKLTLSMVADGKDATFILTTLCKPTIYISIAQRFSDLGWGSLTVDLVKSFIQSQLGSALARGAKRMSVSKAETWDEYLAIHNKTSTIQIAPITDWVREDKAMVPVFSTMSELAMPDVGREQLDDYESLLLSKL